MNQSVKIAPDPCERIRELEARVAELEARASAGEDARSRLAASEARLRTVFETMTEGFVLGETVCDAAGNPHDIRYLEVNPAFEHHTGIPACDFVGRTLRGMFPDAEEFWFERLSRVALKGEPVHFEAPFGPLGRWFELSAYQTEPGRHAAIFYDITDRVRAAEEAKRLSTELADRVGELQCAEKQLRDADARKSEFLAVLSHELRNPLAPIRNCVFILEHSAPGSTQARRALEVIDRQTGQLARLVDDLLDVTRILRHKIELHHERLEMNELVRCATEDHRSLFERAGVHLELRVAAEPVPVIGDRNRLTQVVGNLLQNAAKFTPRDGKVGVSVSIDAPARRAVVRICDTGVGIAPPFLDHVFEQFAQADDTLPRDKGGLGLGLALVKGLVELHGGDVRASSPGIGEGSEFVLRLPLQDPPVEPRAPAPAARSHRRRVLVVEDNVDAAISLSEVLVISDHDVVVAYDGREGLAKAREFQPDVVFCDLGLPGMSGYDFARTLRADAAFDRVHLVAVSGHAQPDDLRRAAEAGFERHVAKPPSPEALLAIVSSF
jgi:signal transduction histidine kinase/CheY-like chemotaxis protein